MANKKKKPDAQSKKSSQKAKQKTIEDKTFGLKNKNKSKKVQAHIASIQKNVHNSGDPKMRKLDEQRTARKAQQKAARKAAKEEQEALFGAALLAVQKKETTSLKSANKAVGRDGNDDAKKPSTSRAMKMMFQMDAQEMEEKLKEDPNYVPTLEDEIEAQRQKKVAELKASGQGTPVTPETFKAWQERKRIRKVAEMKKLLEAESKKRKGGKGLSILSGRALYEYKRDLFNTDDDDDGDDIAVSKTTETTVEAVAKDMDQNLFLEGDDEDLDDLLDD